MSEKSYVSLEQRICVVCGSTYDTGSILLDKRLRESMGRYTTTGWGLCTEHQQLFDAGFVALVEIDPQRSGVSSQTDRLKSEQAYRTGQLAHLKRDVFASVFNAPIEDKQPLIFVEIGVIEKIKAMTNPTPD